MSDDKLYPVPSHPRRKPLLDPAQYRALYKRSVEDPEGFWAEQAQVFLHWDRPWDRVLDWDYHKAHIRWFEGGKLNVSSNCLDRHLEKRGDQTAILWEGDDPGEERRLSYRELHAEVCRLANVLRQHGVKKGDRVCIYMPMVPEAAVAMLACARIGAVHSVVFGGFSPESIKDRILDSDCRVVITADEGLRGGKRVPLKANTDEALAHCPNVSKVLVLKRTGGEIGWDPKRDVWYHEAVAQESADCPPEPMDAEDPLFSLYTSGSTGKPKGVLHTTGGYLLYAAITHKYVFDYQEGEVYWCTADVGWVTGHSYIVYGPLCNGATSLMFEGVPNHPSASRFWEIAERYGVTIFYTAPTAIRACMKWGAEYVEKADLSKLRLLGTVGEPINPKAWLWYHKVVGGERCPIVDTWWQTETGSIMISPLPGITSTKPGSATKPLPGILPEVVDEHEGKPIDEGQGLLVMKRPWPSMLRTLFRDDERFVDTYFSRFGNTTYLVGDA